MKPIVKKVIDENYDSASFTWEMIKFTVRGNTIQYATQKKKAREVKLVELENKAAMLDSQIESMCFKDQQEHLNENKQEYLNTKKQIEEIIAYKMQGAMIRCKANWLEFGEKSSKYFFALERHRQNNKNIQGLKLADGTISGNQKKISDRQADFYEDLYTLAGIKVNWNYLQDLNGPKLTLRESQELDKVLHMDEIKASIKAMAINKCPGTDRISVQFYRVFWEDIKIILYYTYQEAIEQGKFHLSARRGIISLMEKKGKEPLDTSNWRPLTLMNVDYRIVAKILARRMVLILPSLIHTDQTGFMKGRYTSQNLIKLLSTIEYCYKNNTEAIIVSFDLEKAFNKVE